MTPIALSAWPAGLQADDTEIERYAVLLDCLGVALLVYRPDAEVCLSNALARAMLNNGPALFTDESGIALTEENQPAALVLRAGRAIQNAYSGSTMPVHRAAG